MLLTYLLLNIHFYTHFIYIFTNVLYFLSSLVYCCCCLANVSVPGVGVAVPEFRPFFYVNVADIDTLDTELSYVACECLESENRASTYS